MTIRARFIASALAAAAGMPVIAAASAITFDFNALSNNANNAAVQAYMRAIIEAAAPGTSSGFTVIGSKATKDYDGDDHVTGPSDQSRIRSGSLQTRASYSETLGTTDGGVHHAGLDTFLINIGSSDRITMVFPFPVYSAQFDFEIFPDAACSNGFSSSCNDAGDANWPDFKFVADGNQLIEWVGVNPADMTQPVAYRQSPASGWGNNERAPQLLGVSGVFQFANGVTRLEFVDWPSTIGIDNLVITREPPETPPLIVPEPSTLSLAGLLLAGIGLFRPRKPRRA